ncbi:hypothetical protein B0920_13535 [Massilia sp. KIM]|uniref:LysE family translocator n=1 Tax=Massilia sp. KIM TaxID=1955422 RepID=UPI0009D451CC|nr:LysE family transporter [Massilia sp. KIM]OON64303.1 hypothetical protein B0920_13535 [Massilia sp. KIM]
MGWETYLMFVLTTGLVCLTPGPAALLVVAQGMSTGLRGAYAATAGIALANAFYFALSATGLAALLVASSTLFSIIKWLGVAYLFWLGIGALRNRAGGLTVAPAGAESGGWRAFRRGVVLELSNPKALLYFVALLPQFVDPARPLATQMLICGATTVLLDFGAYSVYAWLASRTRRFTANAGFVRNTNRAAGLLLMLAGGMMATLRAA